MALYRNVANFPLCVGVGTGEVVVRPGEAVNLDSSEVESAWDSIQTGELQPVPATPLHHNDSEANFRFVEKMVELLEGFRLGPAFKDDLESVQERNDWLSQVTKPGDALTLMGDIDGILAHLEQKTAPGPKFTTQVQELRKRWEIRREALRDTLVPTAWERIVTDDPEEG